jgi:hypothetical protein
MLKKGSVPAPGAVFRALAENPRGLEIFKGSCRFARKPRFVKNL